MKIDIAQLEFVHIKLRNLLVWTELQTGFEFTGTSLFRMNDKGVHGTLPLRGTDYRMRNKHVGEAIAKMINDVWKYDSKRPEKVCAYLHGKGSNMHLHLQIHPNTIMDL